MVPPPVRVEHAVHDPSLSAVVVDRMPLRSPSAAPADGPTHVRAGSALARVGGRLAVVQDDVRELALVDLVSGIIHHVPFDPIVVDPASGILHDVPLDSAVVHPVSGGIHHVPRDPTLAGTGSGTRGRTGRPAPATSSTGAADDKSRKLDLEACVMQPMAGADLLWLFGSGSGPRRERVVCVTVPRDRPVERAIVYDAHAWYEQLRAAVEFAGSDLNVEGAVLLGPNLRLFQRANGAARDGLRPVNATADFDFAALRRHLAKPLAHPPPAPQHIVRYDLGAFAGVPLGFTDATVVGDMVIYLAVAEDSPDAVQDGPVLGAVVGRIGPDAKARWTRLLDATGRPFDCKVEGLSFDPADPGRGFVVLDPDDPAVPCDLCRIRLTGPWSAPAG